MSIALRSMDLPGEAAARILARTGLAVLFVGLPCTGLFWRGAPYVLVPVGAILILIGALVDAPQHAGRRFFDALASRGGAAALLLMVWAGLSLAWTPFPAEAGARFMQLSAASFLAALASFYLPHKTKTFDLYVLPAGLAIASAMALVLLHLDRPWFTGGFAFDESLFERAMITSIVLVWPALGFLALREHWIGASALAILITAVAAAGFAQIALLAMGAGALVFAFAMSQPQRAAQGLAWAFAALAVLAPLLPLIISPLLRIAGTPASFAAAMATWSELIGPHWPRLITGHGFDFVHQGVSIGYLPAETPRSLLFVLWYDLGIIGAACFALLATQAFRAAGRLPSEVAPALLAGLTSALVLATLGIVTLQIWWLTLLACNAIAFALLVNSLDKARRPGVGAIRAIDSRS